MTYPKLGRCPDGESRARSLLGSCRSGCGPLTTTLQQRCLHHARVSITPPENIRNAFPQIMRRFMDASKKAKTVLCCCALVQAKTNLGEDDLTHIIAPEWTGPAVLPVLWPPNQIWSSSQKSRIPKTIPENKPDRWVHDYLVVLLASV